jgi:hypothetical protein
VTRVSENARAGFAHGAPPESFRSRGRTITEADVVAFSALTGDWHPQHSDAVWAAHSSFGERIAHGMLIVSFAVGLVAFDPEHVVALRRIRDVVFNGRFGWATRSTSRARRPSAATWTTSTCSSPGTGASSTRTASW